MTPIADMVEKMLAESAPAAAVVAAVRAMESITLRHVTVTPPSRDASRDAAREKANARARKYRNSKKIQRLAKANDVAADGQCVTELGVMRHVTQPNLAVVLSIKEEGLSSEVSKKKEKSESARARGTRLAAGTPLSDEHRAVIIAEGIADPEKLWAEFVDYWSDIPGQRGCKISWSGTLRNRCREVIKRGNNGNRNFDHRAHSPTGSAPTRDAAVIAGMGRALERRRAARAADDARREEFRGCSGAVPGDDAELGSAPCDDAAPRQLTLIPGGNAGQ